MGLITVTKINALPIGSKQLPHGGVSGLVYIPSTSQKGQGSWRFRFQSPVDEKAACITIGKYPTLGIADAADKARELHQMIDSGLDPRIQIKQAKAQQQQAQLSTFEKVARDFIQEKIQAGVWRNKSYGEKTLLRLEKHIFPSIGQYPIDTIKSITIKDCLSPIWHDKQETSKKLLTYISQIFTWAESLEICQHNPVSAARVALGRQAITKSPVEKRMPAMLWQDVPRFVADVLLGTKPTLGKYALLFQLLNAARSGAVRNMEFNEIDFDTAVWTMPAFAKERKTNINRHYPLSTHSLALLGYQQQNAINELVFSANKANNKGSHVLSDMALTNILRGCADTFPSDIVGRCPVPHGFRSTFRNWASECGYEEKLAELQLAHEVGNKVQRAYDRSSLIEPRREMMQAWSDFCFSSTTSDPFAKKQ